MAVFPAAFDADVQRVIAGNLNKYHLNEHLGLGTVEIRQYLHDIRHGLIGRDDHHAPGFGIDAEIGVRDGAVSGILPSGGVGAATARAGAPGSAGSANAARAKTSASGSAAAGSLLGLKLKRAAGTKEQC